MSADQNSPADPTSPPGDVDAARPSGANKVPAVEGVLTASEIAATGSTIAELQLPSGQIPWFPGGHCDPWNHIETAMALDTVGLVEQATRAYEWLIDMQYDDGSWHHYYIGDDVEDDKFDANTIAYVATGAWHRWLLWRDRSWLELMWPVVDRAIEWVLELQRPVGDIIWARHRDGTPFSFSLLTGSSSIAHSLRAACAIAGELGFERPHWHSAADRLAACVRDNPGAFAPKDRWAMDWYYPVLTGVVVGQTGRDRLAASYGRFVIPGYGVRCVADQDWVTSAETCEAAMAYLAADERDRALDLFTWAQVNRDTDGAYFTGLALPDRVHFPGDERSAYTAAAIILAADALSSTTAASHLLWQSPTTIPG